MPRTTRKGLLAERDETYRREAEARNRIDESNQIWHKYRALKKLVKQLLNEIEWCDIMAAPPITLKEQIEEIIQ